MAASDTRVVEDTRRIAAFAAFGIAASIVYIPVSILIGMALGMRPPSDADLSAQVASIVAQPIGYGSTGFTFLLLGASLAVLALALHEELHRAAPFAIRIATAAGVVGAAQTILAGFGPLTLAKGLARIDGQDHGAAVAVYLANTLVSTRLSTAGVVMFGTFVLIASLQLHRVRLVARVPSYLGILLGITLIASPLLPGPLVFAPVPIMLVWSVWLGTALLRREPRVARSMGAPTPTGA